eukprot:COSAG01_NODE_11321_length_1959_cov_1.694624_2_plen_167_part_00
MQIFVQTLSSKSISLHVGAQETVQSLQERLHEREGVPCDQQRLLFGGRMMPAGSSSSSSSSSSSTGGGGELGRGKPPTPTLLSQCGVVPHCTVQLLLRGLNGGGGDGGSTCNDRLWVEMRSDILNAQGDSFDKRQVGAHAVKALPALPPHTVHRRLAVAVRAGMNP